MPADRSNPREEQPVTRRTLHARLAIIGAVLVGPLILLPDPRGILFLIAFALTATQIAAFAWWPVLRHYARSEGASILIGIGVALTTHVLAAIFVAVGNPFAVVSGSLHFGLSRSATFEEVVIYASRILLSSLMLFGAFSILATAVACRSIARSLRNQARGGAA